ncbi:hypothetical protein PAN31117_03592 [Pandoraea anapnoica]|uniref:Uncharacterized protein n=1 Tax=Pandoraea anapnoica TaxID=2508301 RepID=A0A5E5A9C4_9BURK|nr:hypothetical protein [Pandoraea anapnoica]VVE70209.1 hypothetical protein PAN31117_03592 [Pandoraea anapnoica]
MDTKSKSVGVSAPASDEDDGTLDPPQIEGVTDGKLDPALVPNGPKITMPEWPGMAEGDRLEWFWLGTSAGGQDSGDSLVESVGDVVVTVSRTVLEINANGGDTVTAVYAVTPQGGERETSGSTLVEVLPLNDDGNLPAPVVLEAKEGVLNPDDLTGEATVEVAPYEGMASGDHIWAYFGEGTAGEYVDDYFVTDNNVGRSAEFYVPKANVVALDGGNVTVYYKVIRKSGETVLSNNLVLSVGEPVGEPLWPAPYVQEADGDYLPEEAYQQRVRTVVPQHADMQAGDEIYMYWGPKEDPRHYWDRVVVGVPMDFAFRMTKDDVEPWKGEIVPVYYTITRGATVIHSEVLKLGVAVEPQKLALPEMPQRDGNGELNLNDIGNRADVIVPAYEGMRSGDVVFIDWGAGAGHGGLTLTNHVSDHTVGDPIEDYFIAEDLVPFIGMEMPLTYRVRGALIEDRSDALMVKVVREAVALEPPRVPAVVDGKLDPRLVTGGLAVIVPRSPEMAQGNMIRLKWQSTHGGTDYTPEMPVGGNGDINFNVPYEIIEEGVDSTVTVSYDLLVGGQVVASGGTTSFVIEQSALPAVVVLEADDGNLDPDDVTAAGATVYIDDTAAFALDDTVTVTWKGPPNYTSDPYTVKVSDVGRALELRIPKATVEQSNGAVVEITYAVVRKASGLTEESPPATYTVGRELASGDLIVLGARNGDFDKRVSGASKYLRAVSAATREDIVAEWRYSGDTSSVSGSTFLDSEPWRLLHVRTETASTSILPLHLVGTGVDTVTGNGLAAYGALFDTAGPYAWGMETHGGKIDTSLMGLDGVQLSATYFAVALRLVDGRAVMWGDPANGGPITPYPSNVARICGNAGAFAYVRNDGTLGAWGNTIYAGVVDGDALTVTDADKVIPNTSAFCCLRKNGKIVAWGTEANGGVLPDLNKDETVLSVRGSTAAFCALRPNNTLFAWGNEANGGELSDDVAAARDIVELAAATNGAFAVITSERKVMAWGSETFGGVVPQAVELLDDIVEVVANAKVFCARREDGRVVTWGGTGPTDDHGYPLPEDLALERFVQITASGGAFAGLKRDGTVLTWGDPARGGDSAAVQPKLVNIRAVYSNSQGFAAIPATGGVVSWGVADGGGTPTSAQQQLLDRYIRYEVDGKAVSITSPQGRALAAYRKRQAALEKA